LTGAQAKPQSVEFTVEEIVADSPGESVIFVPLTVPIDASTEQTDFLSCAGSAAGLVRFAAGWSFRKSSLTDLPTTGALLVAFADVELLGRFRVETWKLIITGVLSCVPSASEGWTEESGASVIGARVCGARVSGASVIGARVCDDPALTDGPRAGQPWEAPAKREGAEEPVRLASHP
jgi:hypothetical protein